MFEIKTYPLGCGSFSAAGVPDAARLLLPDRALFLSEDMGCQEPTKTWKDGQKVALKKKEIQ